MTGNFMPGQILPSHVPNVVGGNPVVAVFEHNNGGDLFYPFFVWTSDDSYLGHSLMAVDRVLNFARGNQYAACVDHIFYPINYFDIPFVVNHDEVSGTEPSIHKGLLRLFRFIPISGEQLWRPVLHFSGDSGVNGIASLRSHNAPLDRRYCAPGGGRTSIVFFGPQDGTQGCHFTLSKAVIKPNTRIFLP